jgi:ribosomal-protein-alanine N-acetyltransferase
MRCFYRAWPPGYVAHELALPQSEFWLAFDDDNEFGYLHFWVVAEQASLLSMAVVPELQRRGLGRALMEFLETRLADLGCSEVQLEVRIGNAAALALYGELGFVEVGRRTGYYTDTGEDAVLMSKALDSGSGAE